MADRVASVEITAHSRNLATQLRAARAKFSNFVSETRSSFNKRVGGAVSSFAGNFGANVASRGLDVLVDGARDAYAFNDALTRFGISASQTPEQLDALRTSIGDVSTEIGVNRDELLAGAAQYVSLTGAAGEAAASVRTFGRVAQASNSSLTDIAATGASLRDNLKINPADFEAAFGVLITQGKAGAIELKDLAGQLSSIAPSFSAFADGTGVEGMAEMGAALQFVRKGFGSAGEAGTGFRALMVSINRNAEKFQKAGVQIYDTDPKTGVKTLRNFSQIIDGIAESDLARDPTLLTKAFGSDEAKRAFDQLAANRGEMQSLIVASKEAGVVQRDLAKYTESDAGRVKLAWTEAKNALAAAFTPERIQAFAAALVEAAKALGWVVDKAQTVISTAEKVGRGAAILVGGLSGEDQANVEANRARNARVMELVFRRQITWGDASKQVAQEDAARKMLRAGDYDRRGSANLMEQRTRISEGVYSNKDELLRAVDAAIARAKTQEASTGLKNAVRDGLREAGALNAVTVGGDTIFKAIRMAGNAMRTRPDA